MKVYIYPADHGGCGWHRCFWIQEACVRAGYDVRIGKAPALANAKGMPLSATIAMEVRSQKPDVVVIQRPLNLGLANLCEMLTSSGVAVVAELDDDFTVLPHGNIGREHASPKADPYNNWDHLMRGCQAASFLTCSTPLIAEHYGHPGRTAVVRNRIPTDWLWINIPRFDPTSIIWTGVVEYHPHDLEVTGSAIGSVCTKTGAVFRTIGGSDLTTNISWPTEILPWLPCNKPEYPTGIAHHNIGIAPLSENVFNYKSKSSVKGLEYSALGLPFVASPTDEYQLLAEMGAGELASTPRQWMGILKRLIQDQDWREQRGREGREIAAQLTHDKAVPEYIDAWTAAADWAHSA